MFQRMFARTHVEVSEAELQLRRQKRTTQRRERRQRRRDRRAAAKRKQMEEFESELAESKEEVEGEIQALEAKLRQRCLDNGLGDVGGRDELMARLELHRREMVATTRGERRQSRAVASMNLR